MANAIRNAWLIPLLPLLGAVLTAALGRRLKGSAHLPVVLLIGLSFLFSISLVRHVGPTAIAHHGAEAGEHGTAGDGHVGVTATHGGASQAVSDVAPRSQTKFVYPWITVGGREVRNADGSVRVVYDLVVPVEFRVDGLTVMMLCMVTFVSTLVALFAVGYMRGDPGYARFFAEIGLFVASMTGLVLSNNYVLTYAFWEGVGVCSYLLIGFWYAKPSAAAAAKKAFLVNRIGDVGFALAIFLMWSTTPGHSLSYDVVLGESYLSGMMREAMPVLVTIAGLLLWASTAKSAQVPLYVWLPDAMEGPTPVSALIHAATMVTAGVYLLARSAALVFAHPVVPVVVCIVGAVTALLAALMALTQNDLKRVLAYSTISQLGFMFMGLGCGIGNVMVLAVVAAMFHLFTHAFFKALLFLGSGAVMHSMGHVIDMRRFGGLRKRMPTTAWTFAVGGLALAGIVPLAGFWSKDEILMALRMASGEAREAVGAWAAAVYGTIYVVALITAFLTAFYTGRAFFKTFWGPEKLPSPDDPEAEPDPDGHAHDFAHDPHFGHEVPSVMRLPLVILALCTIVVGLAFGPLTGLFANWVERTPSWSGLAAPAAHGADWLSIVLGTLVGVGGLALSWWMYARPNPAPARLAQQLRPLYRLSYGKFFVDEIYTRLIVRPVRGLAIVARFLDVYVVDGLVKLVAWIPRVVGRDLLGPIQNGLVQFYAGASALGLVILLVVLLLR